MGSLLQKPRTKDVGLPSFELAPQALPSPSMPEEPVATDQQLFLLLCMNDGRGASTIRARQPNIHDIDLTGNSSKCFVTITLHSESGGGPGYHFGSFSTSTLCTSRCTISISWTPRELDAIPPNEMATLYRYERSKLKPRIGSNLVMHYFRCPQDLTTHTPCLRKTPKKINQELTVCPVKGESPGRGLYLVEGWSWKKILTGSCLVFILISTAVGILRWKFERSIQGAFAIGSFIYYALLLVLPPYKLG